MRQTGESTGARPRRWLHALVAMAIAILALPAAAALDWHYSARSLQQEADSYAIVLASLAAQGRLPPRIKARPGVSISFSSPPAQGAYAGRTDAVRVEAQRLWSPPFPALFGGTRPMTAHATAARPRVEGTDERPILRVE